MVKVLGCWGRERGRVKRLGGLCRGFGSSGLVVGRWVGLSFVLIGFGCRWVLWEGIWRSIRDVSFRVI